VLIALSTVPLVGAVLHAPVVWIIGLILLIAGVVSLLRGGIFFGVVLIVIGLILGALNIL
jgi:hypothetical protein